MADIIRLSSAKKLQDDDADEIKDLMLVGEGLSLLAAYKKIEDPTLRASLLRLMKLLGGLSPDKDTA